MERLNVRGASRTNDRRMGLIAAAGTLLACLLLSARAGATLPATVLHLPLSEGAGTRAYDPDAAYAPYGIVGTPTWAAGRTGYCLDTRVNSQAVEVYRTLVGATEIGSYSCWVKTDTQPASTYYIMGESVGGSNPCWYLSLLPTTGYIRFTAQADRTNPAVGLSVQANQNTLGAWTHIVVTFDLTATKIYVNGVLRATGNSGTRTQALNNKFIVGRFPYYPATTNHFYALLDDVRVYDQALTPEQVTELYTAADADVTPPTIQSVQVTNVTMYPSVGGVATVAAPTNEAARLNVEYGTSAAYGSWGAWDATWSTAGTRTIQNLLGQTLYHFRVWAIDAAGNVSVTDDQTFTTPARPTDLYVSPTGRNGALGTIEDPIDLVSAVTPAANVTVLPGDTIWLLGGTYNIVGTLNCGLNGADGNPIKVRQYPGARATLDTGANTNNRISVNGSNTWYWGFEVMSSAPNRWGTSNSSIPDRGLGIDAYGPNVKFINMVVHDAQSGINPWTPATNAEVYGCLIYYTGYDYTDRGHGHAIYTQNDLANNNSHKWITDNILFAQFSHGLHAYTEGGKIDNFIVAGNISFDNGIISTISGGTREFLNGGAPIARNPVFQNNCSYVKPAAGGTGLDLGYGAGVSNCVVTDNYFVGRNTAFNLKENATATITGNTFYGTASGFVNGNFPDNTYYGLTRPTGLRVFLRPNQYEPGRASICVYNWDNLDSANIDVSSVLNVNDIYEVRDAQNYYGAPAAGGIYTGGSIAVPLNLTEVSPVIGTPCRPYVHTPKEFNAFILIRTGIYTTTTTSTSTTTTSTTTSSSTSTTSTSTTSTSTTSTTEEPTTTTEEPTTTTAARTTTTSTTASTTSTTLPAPIIIDNTDTAPSKRFQSLLGTWTAGTSLPGYYGTNYLYAGSSPNKITARARWSTTLLPAGHYKVYARWPASSNRSRSTAYVVINNDVELATVRVDQTINGGTWVLLGAYVFTAGGHAVDVHNGQSKTTGSEQYVGADAVRFEAFDPAAPTTTTLPPPTTTLPLVSEAIIDNASNPVGSSFAVVSGTWSTAQSLAGKYGADYAYASTSTGGETARARFSCTHLLPGAYDIYAWWPAYSNRSQREPYVIKDGSVELATVRVDQTINGGQWNLLGTFTLSSITGIVEVHNGQTKVLSTEGYIGADAVRFVRR